MNFWYLDLVASFLINEAEYLDPYIWNSIK